MPNNIKISSLAQKELFDSVQWYEYQTSGLGDEFTNTIMASLKVIQQTPELFNKTKVNYREYTVRRFPFVIVYKHKNDIVEVLHFFHTSRNPKLKYRQK